MARRWLLLLVVAALACGSVLSLPYFWGRPVVGEKSSQVVRHWLHCVFTASSALTGTGLSPHDIGDDFNVRGQVAILVLMQAGGLAVLAAGSLIGWRLRQRLRWGGEDAGDAVASPGRMVVFSCAAMLAFEAAGAAVIYAARPGPEAGGLHPGLNAVFLSVSAFCNAGLTLTRDSLVDQRLAWIPYAVALPLMLLGSVGGPVLYDLGRRLRRGGAGGRLPRDARITLVGTAAVFLLGAGLLFFIESTPRWQLRNPREDTPGQLKHAGPREDEPIVFSSAASSSARSQRLRTMEAGHRAAAAAFLSQSSRGGGLRVARLDEASLAPASRAVMMALMLIGGGVGGTAGGLRILVIAWLMGLVFSRRNGGLWPGPAIRAAAGVAVGMCLLIGGTLLVLAYRESGSFEACAFEAVSACCNCGLSAGLTRRLSVEGEAAVILAMLVGRVLPLAMLARAARGEPAIAPVQ